MKKQSWILLLAFAIANAGPAAAKEPARLIEKASAGDADAQYAMGMWYYKRSPKLPVDIDRKEAAPEETKAREWLSKAAEQGHDEAQFRLGMIYKLGKGVEVDYVEACKWFSRSAGQGNKDAKSALKSTRSLLTPEQLLKIR